jgi:hypothetical protein
MFSRTRNSMALMPMLADVTGRRNFKMATDKPEILISQLLDKIGTKFTIAKLMFSRTMNPMSILRILSDVTGCRNSKRYLEIYPI